MSRTTALIGLGAIAILALMVVRFAPTEQTASSLAPANTPPQPVNQVPELDKLEPQKWHEFSSPNEHFKVLFPTLPQHATEKIEDPTTKETRHYEMFVSEKSNGTIFMISVITLLEAPDIKVDENMLKAVINNMVAASPNSKLKTMEMSDFKGHSSMDFAIENDQINVDGKAFAEGNTLYLLTSVAKKDQYLKKEFEFFVNSFQLLSSKKSEESDK